MAKGKYCFFFPCYFFLFKYRQICIMLLLHFSRGPGNQRSDHTQVTQVTHASTVLFSPGIHFALHTLCSKLQILQHIWSDSPGKWISGLFLSLQWLFSQIKGQKDADQCECLSSCRHKPATFSPRSSVTFFNYWKAESVTGGRSSLVEYKCLIPEIHHAEPPWLQLVPLDAQALRIQWRPHAAPAVGAATATMALCGQWGRF